MDYGAPPEVGEAIRKVCWGPGWRNVWHKRRDGLSIKQGDRLTFLELTDFQLH